MSEWKIAIDLAHEYDVPNIDSLLSKYAEHLLMKEKYFDIVELYRKANKVFDASSMLLKVIEDAKRDKKSDPILLKKLYTLIGLLYEENRKSPTKQNKKSGTLNSLLSDDSFSFAATNFKSLDEPWKGCAPIYIF
jgi:WD repeat-containing protein 35